MINVVFVEGKIYHNIW